MIGTCENIPKGSKLLGDKRGETTSITIEQLKRKFPEINVPPHGPCLIVSDSEFRPDWEVSLREKGYKCFHINLDDKQVILVRLEKTNEIDREKASLRSATNQTVPPLSKGRSISYAHDPAHRWTPQEDELLAKLWNDHLTKPQIAERCTAQIPNRTPNAVILHLNKMMKTGKIQSRSYNQPPKDEKEGDASTSKAKLNPEHNSEADSLTQNTVAEKIQCHIIMQALSIREQRGELALPQSLWKHYTTALLEDDGKFRMIFQEKVRKFLDASE